MTISTVIALDKEEKEALRTASEVLREIISSSCFSDLWSTMYYSDGQISFDNLSDMEQVLDGLANAEELDLEP